MIDDWYERRDELEPGMVFKSCYGVVKLDHRKPGDGTDWMVADWASSPIDPCGSWAYYESTIHPADLIERLPDDYAGRAPTLGSPAHATDIDKLAQQMREAAEGATPGHIVSASPDRVLALLGDRERLVAEVAAATAAMEMAATSGAFWARRAENAEAALGAKGQESDRLKAALAHEERYLLRLLADDNLMRGDIEGAFHRLRTGDFADALATSGGGNG